MTTIAQLIHRPAEVRTYMPSDKLVDQGLVGVEIELENMSHAFRHVLDDAGTHRDLRYWLVKNDGSLKDRGAEFVFLSPLAGLDVVSAIEEFENYIISTDSKPKTSIRTSVHVHLDVRDFTKEQLLNLVLLYTIFEKALFNYCGKDRINNIFCLSMQHGEASVAGLGKLLKATTDRDFYAYLTRWSKYCAINISASTHFGSVEFRGHAGEWRAEPLLNWINILMRLRVAAKNLEIPWETMPTHISGMGPYSFFQAVFGEHSPLLDYPDIERDILEGVRLSQDALYWKPASERAWRIPQVKARDKESLLAHYTKDKYPDKYVRLFGKEEDSAFLWAQDFEAIIDRPVAIDDGYVIIDDIVEE